jgi:ketosteroid isomerase-like protein
MSQSEIIRNFYEAFQRRDYRQMQTLYHDEGTFSDPVFQNLDAKEVRAMWAMLLTSSKDLRIEFGNITADSVEGQCHWEAWYTFSRTQRPVHNIIDAAFTFRDGKILRHHDTFDFWRWSRQALGMTGILLGWSPLIKNKIRVAAKERLSMFMQS